MSTETPYNILSGSCRRTNGSFYTKALELHGRIGEGWNPKSREAFSPPQRKVAPHLLLRAILHTLPFGTRGATRYASLRIATHRYASLRDPDGGHSGLEVPSSCCARVRCEWQCFNCGCSCASAEHRPFRRAVALPTTCWRGIDPSGSRAWPCPSTASRAVRTLGGGPRSRAAIRRRQLAPRPRKRPHPPTNAGRRPPR